MAFDVSLPFIGYDPQVPLFGVRIASREVRENFKILATNARGTQEPVTPGQLRGDTRNFPVNLTGATNLKIKIDNLAYVTVNCSTGGSSAITARTLADIVSAINTQLNTAYSTSGQVWAFAADGYLYIRSLSTNPAISAVTVDSAASADGKELLLALSLRGVTSYPYAVTGTTPSPGRLWHVLSATTPHLDQRLALRVDRPARIRGFTVGTSDLTVRKWVRLTIDGVTNEFNVATGAGNAAAVTVAEIAARINTVFGATVAYDTGAGLLVQSNVVGSTSTVSFARPTGSGGYEDATPLILGLVPASPGKEFDAYPIADTGINWSSAWMREVEAIPGLGTWGPPVRSRQALTTPGAFHGEIRVPLDSLVPHAWDARVSLWIPAGIRGGRHVVHDSTYEVFAINRANPQWYGESDSAKTVLAADVRPGMLVETRDVRDELNPATASGGNLSRTHDAVDNFTRTNATTLGTSSSGDAWAQALSAGNGWRIAANQAAFDGTPGGTDVGVIDEAFTSSDVIVAAQLAKNAGTSGDANPCAVGLIFRAADASNYYVARVEERGNIVLARVTAGVETVLATFAAKGDPLLSATFRTLRVVSAQNGLTSVYWGGSIHPQDWSHGFEARFLAGSHTIASPQAGTKTGIYGTVVAASGKEVYAKTFIARSTAVGSEDVPGYPALPGNRIRQIITAIQAPDSPTIAASKEVVNDTSMASPVKLTTVDGLGAGGVNIEQDTAGRGFKFQLGSQALRTFMTGLAPMAGDPDGTYTSQYAIRRINVGPGAAVIATGLTFPDYKLMTVSGVLTLSLDPGDNTYYRAPLEGGSPVQGRCYYLYLAYRPTGATLEYGLTPPKRWGGLTQSGLNLRFVCSFFYTNEHGQIGIRGFYKSGTFVRFALPNGSIGNSGIGASIPIFTTPPSGNNDYFLGAEGAGGEKKAIPRTSMMARMLIIAQDSSGDKQLRFSTSGPQGLQGIIGIDRDNDGEYAIPVSPDLYIRVAADAGLDTAKAGVIGYDEDPQNLPPWLAS